MLDIAGVNLIALFGSWKIST